MNTPQFKDITPSSHGRHNSLLQRHRKITDLSASEEFRPLGYEILRCTQDDKQGKLRMTKPALRMTPEDGFVSSRMMSSYTR
jgi:hypothetical protein